MARREEARRNGAAQVDYDFAAVRRDARVSLQHARELRDTLDAMVHLLEGADAALATVAQLDHGGGPLVGKAAEAAAYAQSALLTVSQTETHILADHWQAARVAAQHTVFDRLYPLWMARDYP